MLPTIPDNTVAQVADFILTLLSEAIARFRASRDKEAHRITAFPKNPNCLSSHILGGYSR